MGVAADIQKPHAWVRMLQSAVRVSVQHPRAVVRLVPGQHRVVAHDDVLAFDADLQHGLDRTHASLDLLLVLERLVVVSKNPVDVAVELFEDVRRIAHALEGQIAQVVGPCG